VVKVEPDGRFKVIAVGDSGHLLPSLTTGATGDLPHTLAIPGQP
jgi:serine/threonine-protein phosphatase PGAM5